MATVSALLPTHRNDAYLQEAVASILCQTFRDFELIVVADGLHVNLPDDSRIKLICNPSQIGLPASLNKALNASVGQFITRIDSDDLCPPFRIEKLLAENKPVVTSRYKRIDAGGRDITDEWMDEANRVAADEIHDRIWNENLIVGPAPMWTREVYETIGPFDEVMTVASDYNYWLRVLDKFPIHIVDDVLYFHRKHAGTHRANNYGNIDWTALAKERAR